MKIEVEGKLLKLIPENDREKKDLNQLWNIIIDCDTGIDDALALLLAILAPVALAQTIPTATLSGRVKDKVVQALLQYDNIRKRGQIMEEFRTGACRVLVTTDFASRGLDVPEVLLRLFHPRPEFSFSGDQTEARDLLIPVDDGAALAAGHSFIAVKRQYANITNYSNMFIVMVYSHSLSSILNNI